ncbi:hypothetical protein F5146DRAFT_732150 [Armillaria mellea]|nr:hypothetical protein F5146DRAFT_732150 [Armillaria mellea]
MTAYSPNYCLKAFRAEARSYVLSWLSLLAVSYRVDALPIRLAACKMCVSKFRHIRGAFTQPLKHVHIIICGPKNVSSRRDLLYVGSHN